MIKRGIAITFGVVIGVAGLVMVALMVNPAQAGDPLPGLDISIEQIPGGVVREDIMTQFGRANAYTMQIHETTAMQLKIAKQLTERAAELAAAGDLKGAAAFALMAAELEQRVALKFKAAAGITEAYTRAISQHSTVAQDFGKQLQARSVHLTVKGDSLLVGL